MCCTFVHRERERGGGGGSQSGCVAADVPLFKKKEKMECRDEMRLHYLDVSVCLDVVMSKKNLQNLTPRRERWDEKEDISAA